MLRILPDRLDERAVWSAVLGQAAFAILMLVAGVAGKFNVVVVWIVCAGGVGVGLISRPWARIERPRGRSTGSRQVWVAGSLCALIAVSAVYGALRATTPVTEKDSLGYHLAAPKQYLRDGAITRLDGNPRAWWPATAQMHFAACLALSDHRGAQTLNVLEMLWAALALAVLGRRFFGGESGLWAAALFVTLYQSRRLGGTGTDMFFLTFFGAAALLGALESLDRPSPRAWGLCGVALGAAAGVKFPGLLIVAVVLAVLAAFSKRRVQAVVVAGFVALMVASPWYTRLAAYTGGNPLWPYLTERFGPGPYDASALRAYMAASRSASPVYGATLEAHWLLPAAMLLVFVRPWTRPAMAAMAAWIAGAAAWAATGAQSHLGMPFHAWMAVLAGAGVAKVPRARAVVFGVGVLTIAFAAHHREFDRVRAGAGLLDRDELIRGETDMVLVYEWVNAHAPGERVFDYNGNLLYLIDADYVVGDPMMQGRLRGSADNFWETVRRTGARVVIVNWKRAGPERALFEHGPVIEIGDGRVFRVPPADSP